MAKEKDETRGLAPEGTYRARAARWDWTQNEQGKLTFVVELTTHNGLALTFFGSGSLNDPNGNGSAWDVTTKALRAMGWTGTDPRQIELDRGRVFNIAVEHEVYDGRLRARVAAVWPSQIDARRADRMAVAEMAALLGFQTEERVPQ
jgi:hypothetical protein